MEIGAKMVASSAAATSAERSERLLYLADMLGELQTMAAREGCVTLAGLLALSQVETQRQAKANPKSG